MSMEDGTEADTAQSNQIFVAVKLARIEEKLDEALRQRNDHEMRIRAIERWKYALPFSAMTALMSAVVAVFATLGR